MIKTLKNLFWFAYAKFRGIKIEVCPLYKDEYIVKEYYAIWRPLGFAGHRQYLNLTTGKWEHPITDREWLFDHKEYVMDYPNRVHADKQLVENLYNHYILKLI